MNALIPSEFILLKMRQHHVNTKLIKASYPFTSFRHKHHDIAVDNELVTANKTG